MPPLRMLELASDYSGLTTQHLRIVRTPLFLIIQKRLSLSHDLISACHCLEDLSQCPRQNFSCAKIAPHGNRTTTSTSIATGDISTEGAERVKQIETQKLRPTIQLTQTLA